jgi:hypothetical protein
VYNYIKSQKTNKYYEFLQIYTTNPKKDHKHTIGSLIHGGDELPQGEATPTQTGDETTWLSRGLEG